MALDRAATRRIAHLARIDVAEEDLGALAGELSSILGWIEQLNEVETSDVPPMTSVAAMSQRLRADVVTDGERQGDVLANAPEREDGYYVVPKVVE